MNKTQFNNKYLFKLSSNLNINDKKEDIKMLNNGSLLFYRYYPLSDKYTIKNILEKLNNAQSIKYLPLLLKI